MTKKHSNNFFGRLILVFIIILMIIIYILLIFNQIPIKMNYSQYWILYVVLSLLFIILIILSGPFILRIEKLQAIKKNQKKKPLEEENRDKSKLEREKAKEEKKARKILEKKRRKTTKLRLRDEKKKQKEELKKQKQLEKQRKKEEKLRLRTEKKQRKEEDKKNKQLEKEEKLKSSKEEKKLKKGKIPIVEVLPKNLKIELGRYETDLDILYKIIEQKERIKISTLARYFSVDKKKIEEWVNILEEHKLAKIYYPAIGENEIIKWEK